MGRYIHGDEDFEYKYPFGEQPSNLVWLAEQSGAGRAWLFLKVDVAEGDEHCLRDEELRWDPVEGPLATWSRRADEMRKKLAEDFVALNAELSDPLGEEDRASEIALTGTAVYAISKADYPILLRWINGFLPAKWPLRFEDMEGFDMEAETSSARLEKALEALNDPALHGMLPYLALHMLAHAVAQELEEFSAEDGDAVAHAPLWLEGAAAAPGAESEWSGGAGYEKRVMQAYSSDPRGVLLTPLPRTIASPVSNDDSAPAAHLDRAEASLSSLPADTASAPALRAATYVDARAALVLARPGWERGPAAHQVIKSLLEGRPEGFSEAELLPHVARIVGAWIERGDAMAGIRLLDAVAPDRLLSLRALAFIEAGSKRRAHACARAAVAANEEGGIARYVLGRIHYNKGRYERAARHLQRAIRRRTAGEIAILGGAPSYYFGLAQRHLGRLREAVKAYDAAIAEQPEEASYHFHRAFALDLLGRPKASINAYSQALKWRPDFGSARFNRACEFARIGRADAALRDLARAIKGDARWIESAKKDSYFDPIREDPRFQELVGGA
jgi:tetratricopeptide (TPR) repeat protein